MRHEGLLPHSVPAHVPHHRGAGAKADEHASAHARGRVRKRLRTAIPRLSEFAVEHLLFLPIGALLALVWVNTEPESYYRLSYGLSFIVNEVGMVFFFGLMAKEVVEATAAGGVLHPWRKAALPLIAGLGAAVLPAIAYLAYVDAIHQTMLSPGWPAVVAVDLAASYFVARLIFRRHAVLPFLILLGIGANALGFVALAVFYPIREANLLLGLFLMAAAIASAMVLRKARQRNFWPYVIVGGGLSWFGLYVAGVHPALALLPILPFVPHAVRDPGFFVEAAPGSRDPLNKFELWWRYPVQVVLFLFGLVNAGVSLRGFEEGAWAIPIATLAGRPLGVLVGAGLGVVAGFHLPHRIGWRELTVLGVVTSIGFTFALFFAAAMMPPGQLLIDMQSSVLFGLMGVPLAFIIAKLLRVGRFAPRDRVH